MEKKLTGRDMIMFPIVAFVVLVLIPLLPTVLFVVMGVSKIWLVLTIGWCISWFVGLFIWLQEREKQEEEVNNG